MLGRESGLWPAEGMDWFDYCDSWHVLVHFRSTSTYMCTDQAVTVTLVRQVTIRKCF